MVSAVTFWGHKVDKDSLHLLPDKISAVLNAPTSRNIQELKLYLGLLSYYSKFLPKLSTVLAPLYRLLRKDAHWRRKAAEEKAFELSKGLLTSSHLLVHFDPSLPLILACERLGFRSGCHTSTPDAEWGRAPHWIRLTIVLKVRVKLPSVGRFHSYLFGHQ